jgi:uncharacterized protein (DUF1786 family)
MAVSRFLLLDIGAGTLDLLWYDADSGRQFKAVCRSPVLTKADEARRLEGDILVTGCEMGGGGVSGVLKEKARKNRVVMSASSAATVHHDAERVRSFGIRIVSDDEAEGLERSGRYARLVTGDLDLERIRRLIEGLDVPFAFDLVCACAQDHGVPPAGISHLDFRHERFRSLLKPSPFPESLLYAADRVPPEFNRLRSVARTAAGLPAGEVYVMDSGMAAVLGASLDPEALSCRRLLVLDVATSHTVGAALEEGELCGFFEYHTADVTPERLDGLLEELAAGVLSHRAILAEGGHGAYVRRSFGMAAVERIVATGPKRRLLEGSRLEIHPGAPWGDNMMTGTVGMLEAVHRRKGWGSVSRVW